MDAVMLVEVQDVHGHTHIRQRTTGIGAQCRIGRSLACDVVIDDPFVAAEHTLLTLQEDGRVHVQDLGSVNGTRVNGHRIARDAGEIIARGDLLIGRTHLRVRTQEGSVAPERAFRRDPLRRHRTVLAVLGLAMCFVFAAFFQWADAPENLGPRVLVAELAALAGLAIWVACWALISRLTVGAWQVRIHLSIAAFCVGLWAWGYWLYSVSAFAFQWKWLWMVLVTIAACIALAAAYLHLRHATHFRRPASLSLAVLAPLICGGVWWLVDLQLDPRTVNRVTTGTQIYPPYMRVAPSTDLADYLADAAALKRAANRNRQESLLETPIRDVDE
jgi:FHA domain